MAVVGSRTVGSRVEGLRVGIFFERGSCGAHIVVGQLVSIVVLEGLVAAHGGAHLCCSQLVARCLVLFTIAVGVVVFRLDEVVAAVAVGAVAVGGVHVLAGEVLEGELAVVVLIGEFCGHIEVEGTAGHLEVVAGELLRDGGSVNLLGVAHDVERVDEGVELLHREVVGDERLGALIQSGDGELHGVVVQTADRECSVGAAAADVGRLFRRTCACAISSSE